MSGPRREVWCVCAWPAGVKTTLEQVKRILGKLYVVNAFFFQLMRSAVLATLLSRSTLRYTLMSAPLAHATRSCLFCVVIFVVPAVLP